MSSLGFVNPSSTLFFSNTLRTSRKPRPVSHKCTPCASAAERFKHFASQVATTSAASLTALAVASIVTSNITDIPSHLSLPSLNFVPPAEAAKGGGASFLSASGDVIKDPESLLRWSLPISNKPIRELQAEFEGAINDLKGLKWPKIEAHVKRGIYILNNQTAKILTDVPEVKSEEASKILSLIAEQVSPVESAVQEKSPEKLTRTTKELLRNIGRVEQLLVTGFPYQVPSEYSNLPQLKGRASVELVVKKADDEPFDINGTLYNEGNMKLVLDGYSAPLSAGSFLDLVNKGFYNNKQILRSDGFIIQSGKPAEGEGYKDEKSGSVRIVPLEVFAKGDQMPTYGLTLEDDGRGTAATVLPFTSYGTLAMARTEFEPNSASSQFFWFLFEPDLTPAGRNLMDGNWAVFGYTTEGEKFLRGLQKGDKIVSAKVVDGLENLVVSQQ